MGFWIRKAIFQGVIPIVLQLVTLFDFYIGTGVYYERLYFYTALMIGFYKCVAMGLEILFSVASEQVIFSKPLNLHETTIMTALSQHFNEQVKHEIAVVCRVFKIRYSGSRIIQWVSALCWWLGMDCPVFLSEEAVQKARYNDQYQDLRVPLNHSFGPADIELS